MSNEMFDIPQEQDPGLVEKVRANCEEAAELERTIKGYDAAMKAAKARLHEITTKAIPEAMAEAGLGDTFSLADGTKIKVGPFVGGTLPKEPVKRRDAFEALTAIGGGALIKTMVNLAFGKGDKESADSCVSMLRSAGFEVEPEENVHVSSLRAFVKEKLVKGDEVPLDTLGLFFGSVAKITLPKGAAVDDVIDDGDRG